MLSSGAVLKRYEASRPRSWLFTSLVATVVGCSLIDPLNGISDGRFPSDQASTDGAADHAGDDTTPSLPVDGSIDDGIETPTDCFPEDEPDPQELYPVNEFTMCGTVSATDTDNFYFSVAPGDAYALKAAFVGDAGGATFDLQSPDGQRTGTELDFAVTFSKGYGNVSLTVQTGSTTPQGYRLMVGPGE